MHVKKFKPSVYNLKKGKRYRFPTHINDLIIDRKDTEGNEVFIVILGPDEKPPIHSHPDVEQIFYIISGYGLLSLGKKGKNKLKVKKNQIVYIPRKEYHSIQNAGQKQMVYLAIAIFIIKSKKEPTWDSHIQTICNRWGWDIKKIRKV